MDAYVRAGVDIASRTVRYAEVVQDASGCTVSRLGRIDVEAGVLRNAFAGRDDERLCAVSGALTDIFSGSGREAGLDAVRISISSRTGHAFRVPLAAEAGPDLRRQHLRREIDLLIAPERPLRIVADVLHQEALDAGGAAEWMHVLALDERLAERLRRLVRGAPAKRVRCMSALHAVVSAIGHAEAARRNAGEAACVLGMGWHADRLDYVLCVGGVWRFGGFAEGVEPVDAAYLGAAAAARFGISPADVNTVYAYGDPPPDALFSELEAVFGGAIQTLHPAALPGVSMACSPSEAGDPAYAACIGAALYGGEGLFFQTDPAVPS